MSVTASISDPTCSSGGVGGANVQIDNAAGRIIATTTLPTYTEQPSAMGGGTLHSTPMTVPDSTFYRVQIEVPGVNPVTFSRGQLAAAGWDAAISVC